MRHLSYILSAILLTMVTITDVTAQEVITEARNRGLNNLPGFDHKRVHFGFLIGMNFLDFHIYNSGERTEENGMKARYGEILHLNPGINLGIVTDLRLHEHLNLRCLPGISFGQRDISFIDENGAKLGDPLHIKSTFVDVPLLLKYNAIRFKNVKPYIIGGATVRYDLAKDKQDHITLKSMDEYVDFGGGLDFYLTYFRLSFEIRGSIGLNNVFNKVKISDDLSDLPYMQAINKLKSRMFCLTFYFE